MNRNLKAVVLITLAVSALASAIPRSVRAQEMPGAGSGSLAITGATIIDGTGGAPIPNGSVVIRNGILEEVGTAASVEIPEDATVVIADGKYLTPGFVDTNVHLSLAFDWTPSNAHYWDQHEEVIIQAVQQQLKWGVTTIRDSYGALLPQVDVRDAIARGDVLGPRMYVAGNIVGWGGPYSETFAGMEESDLSLYQERINDFITQGSGERLMHMTPDEVRRAINEYLDKGPDFIKYGGTSHSTYPALIGFSPRVQEVIVEETHARDLIAETHSTTLEGLRLSILAGIDLIQHPEAVGHRPITDELVDLIVDRDVVCSIISNAYSGVAWEHHLKERKEAKERLEGSSRENRKISKTSAERRREKHALEENLELRRANAERLIEAGCTVTVGTDNLLFGYRSQAPEFTREKNPIRVHQEPGIGTIHGIEGLVELGMTPMEALVAATRNGAEASNALDEYGTVEEGKSADLVILRDDPLEDISNIRSIDRVVVRGRLVDPEELPRDRATPRWGEAGSSQVPGEPKVADESVADSGPPRK